MGMGTDLVRKWECGAYDRGREAWVSSGIRSNHACGGSTTWHLILELSSVIIEPLSLSIMHPSVLRYLLHACNPPVPMGLPPSSQKPFSLDQSI